MGRRKRHKRFIVDQLLLEDAASDGHAVGRHEGQVIFVEKGVPGDEVRVNAYKKKKKLLIARIEEVLKPSADRVEAQCKHFGSCGGCKWQMMSYEAQSRFKEKQVRDAIERISKVPYEEFRPILGSEEIFHYRNKLEFSASNKKWLTLEQIQDTETEYAPNALGFHVPRLFDKILHIDECHLQRPIVNDIRNEIFQYAEAHNIPFYDIREHTGYLRNVVFRTSEATQELMLVLIVGEKDTEPAYQLFGHLEQKFPQITNFIFLHNPKLNSSYSDLPFHAWKGEPYITEELGGFRFRISPTSFFQTNPKQAERLYAVVKQFLADVLPSGQSQHELVYDLYAGTGSIGIYVSDLAKKVVGIEYVDSSIEDAWRNVRLNELENFNFYAGDMKGVLSPQLIQKEGRPDVLIADPPRAGMDAKVIDRIIEMQPKHIIYVSCNPATQARDLDLLREHYKLRVVQPVDMFPHTAHVENVVLLDLIST